MIFDIPEDKKKWLIKWYEGELVFFAGYIGKDGNIFVDKETFDMEESPLRWFDEKLNLLVIYDEERI